jgi:L-2,4-diaminobutyrate decarboxylase
VALQRYGANGIGAIYDRLCRTARFLHGAVLARPDFEPLHEPESNIVCFRYLGDGSLDEERLDGLNLRVREAFNRSGEGWLTTTVLDGRRVLRATVMNHRTTAGDVAGVLEGLASVGSRLAAG